MRTKSLAVFSVLFIALVCLQFSSAVDFGQDISNEDKATFDEILEPVMKIYNLVKYSATILAVIVLLFAGVNYVISGSNPAKREQAKSMTLYVIVGLIIIWAGPLIVNFIVG